jgi:hypothetical protein
MPRPRGDATSAFQLRLRPATKQALAEAAARNGRPINSEIAARLERSLEHEHEREHENEDVGRLLRALGEMLTTVGERAARTAGATDWTRSPWAYQQAAVAAGIVLQALRPPGEVTLPVVEFDPELVAKFGEAASRDAATVIQQQLGAATADHLLGPVGTGTFYAGPREFQRLLGPELAGRIEANRLAARSKADRP